MKTGVVTALLLATMAAPARAEGDAAPSLASLKGRYGFNWAMDPSKARCVRITDKQLKDFEKNYTCDLEEKTDSASEHPKVSCQKKDQSKDYLIFKSKKFCEEERETQMMNAD